MNKNEQMILCVPTKKFFTGEIWEGFREMEKGEIEKVIKKFGEYRRRGEMEEDDSWQQIVVQIVLLSGKKIFVHKIATTGNETRLHEMWPIFLGGHVDDIDSDLNEAVEREFTEEIDYRGKIMNKEFVGVINLMDNPVNRVHLGLIYVFEGSNGNFIETGDRGIKDGKFIDFEEAEKIIEKMTYWSKLVFPYLKKKYWK